MRRTGTSIQFMGVSGSAAILLPDTPVCEGIVQVRAVRSVGYAGLWWTRAAGLCACGALGGIMAFSVPLMRCTGSGGSHDSRGDQCFGVAGSGLTPGRGMRASIACACMRALPTAAAVANCRSLRAVMLICA